jgi:NADH-quinone oxidoreductase subunit L
MIAPVIAPVTAPMTALVAAVVVAAPFAAALAGLALGGRRPRTAAPIAVLGTAVSTAAALVLLALAALADRPEDGVLARVPTGGPEIVLGVRVDELAATVAVMVTVVALLVQVYSTGYLEGDPRYPSYAAVVSLFTAAMLLVVLAGDLIVLLVGWEVMGLCSYLLIGHHWELREARSAAIKAFLVTRTGDVAFLFGVLTLGVGLGTFEIGAVLARFSELPNTTLTYATLLLLGGVVGKSAQFPLHTWLPDAMVGPTPISALIHAATMVAAGIYLVARLYPLFLDTSFTLMVLGVLAAVTMLGSALAALAQDDIKRVLAYSTVSQLAYMAGGLAVGVSGAAMFHLLTHAAFKALLFLCAGAVIHAIGSNFMSEMGGLRRALPVTFLTMTVGLAALAGLPPTSGFFSKEAVLVAAEHTARGEGAGPVAPWVGQTVYVVGLVTVAVTAAYAARLWLRTFFGPARTTAVHPHEVTGAMRWPLVALAVPAGLLGFLGLASWGIPGVTGRGEGGWFAYLPRREAAFLTPGEVPGAGFVPELGTSALSTGLALTGLVLAYALWRRDRAADPARALGALRRPFEAAFGVDALYHALVVRPARRLARAVVAVDGQVVAGAVRGSGRGARLVGATLRLSQNGNVTAYLTGLLAGMLALIVGVVVLT